MADRWEEGRRLASERDDLIVAGVDPALLDVPVVVEPVRHALVADFPGGQPNKCSCGGWMAPLGRTISVEFDKHLTSLSLVPVSTLGCLNPACRVVEFAPGRVGNSCPACDKTGGAL